MIIGVPVTIGHHAEFTEIHGARPGEIRVERVIFFVNRLMPFNCSALYLLEAQSHLSLIP